MSAAARGVERLTASSWAPPVAACALLLVGSVFAVFLFLAMVP